MKIMRKLLFFCFLLFFFSFNVKAEDITMTSKTFEKSYDVITTIRSYKINNVNTNEFETNLRYSGDYAKYIITFTNSSKYNYIIHSPNNVNENISYEYDIEGDILSANSSKDIYVTVKCNNDYDNGEILSSSNGFMSVLHEDIIRFEKSNSQEDVTTTKEMNLDDRIDISSIFSDIESSNDIEFNITDPDILKIENGVVIPLKDGETDVIFSYGGNGYVLHVSIKGASDEPVEDEISDSENNNQENSEQENPYTKGGIIIVGIIAGISLLLYVSIRHKKVGQYTAMILMLIAIVSRMIPIVVFAEESNIEFKLKYKTNIYPQRYKVVFKYEFSSSSSTYYGNIEEGLTLQDIRTTYNLSKTTSVYFVDNDNNRTIIVSDVRDKDLTPYLVENNEKAGYYYFYDGSCLVGDSIVIVYDKKRKKKGKKLLKDIDEDDLILCWDFDKGEFTYAKPLWIKKPEIADYYYLLKFENGYSIKVVGDHKLFCVNKNRFMNAGNDNEFQVGDSVYTSSGEVVRLVSHEKVFESIDSYSVITDYHLNMFDNDILTSCVFSNMYEIEDMKYIIDNKDRIDVSKLDVDKKYIDGTRLREVPTDFRGSEEETIKYINKYFSDRDKQKR